MNLFRFLKKALLGSLAAGSLLFTGCGGDSGGGAKAPGSVAPASEVQISIVGSSTVYPFSSYVAEEFGATSNFAAPKVESTGSGGGHKLFYAGVGLETPSITNSSRRIKDSEFEENVKNGNKDIAEIKIGFDGIALCQNKSNEAINLTLDQITLAVAEKVLKDGELVPNPYKKWSDIDASLPDRAIKVLGPPSTSGTRDAFHELVLHKAAEALGYPDTADGREDGKIQYQSVRQDGAWVDSGEDDNLVVRQLANDKNAIGIFGYSFLAENGDKVSAATVNGVAPSPKTVSSGEYPVSRSLFFYVKMAHLGKIDGLEEFVDIFLSEDMIGPEGVLKDRGLIPLPDADRETLRTDWAEKKTLSVSETGDVT